MKKILFTIMVCFLFIIPVYAEKCTVVSGNGKEVGDEIACGTEHFYVMDYNENQIKMLSKYNLYVGRIYYKIIKESQSDCMAQVNAEDANFYAYNDNVCEFFKYINNYSLSSASNLEECKNKYINDNSKKFYQYITISNNSGSCIYFTGIESIKQSELAIGAHGDERGKPEFPEVAITNYNLGLSLDDDAIPNQYYNNSRLGDDYFEIGGYVDTLADMGYNVVSAKMPNLEDIDRVIKKISNRNLPLSQCNHNNWTPVYENEQYGEVKYYVISDLKDYLSNKYSWLYSTTYWLSTKYADETYEEFANDSALFIDTLGYVCTGDECSIVGAGTRPIVTINTSEVVLPFVIESHTDGNGNIEVVSGAYENDVVTFRVIPKSDYKILSVRVIGKNGETITFTEEDLIENADGTISINNFRMPGEDVRIEATFTTGIIVNPKTGETIPYMLMFMLMLMSIIYLVWSRKVQIGLN